MENERPDFTQPANEVFIHVNQDGEAHYLFKTNQAQHHYHQTLYNPQEINTFVDENTNLLLFVPSYDITLKEVSLPAIHDTLDLYQFIQYQLEEQLLDDIELLEFFILKQQEDKVSVAIASKKQYQQWQNNLSLFSSKQKTIIPDVFLLPIQPEQWSLCINKNDILVRTNETQGFCWERDNIAKTLKHLYQQSTQKPKQLNIYSTEDPNTASQLFSSLKLPVNTHDPIEFLELIDDVTTSLKPFRLANSRKKSSNMAKKLRQASKWGAIAIASTYLLVQASLFAQTLFVNQALEKQLDGTLSALYPNATSQSEAIKQMEATLSLSTDNFNDTFLGLFLNTADVLKNIPSETIKTIEFNEENLTIELHLKKFSELSSLIDNLTAQGLMVSQETAETQEDYIVAQLRISLETLYD